jgi:hypothetical protein
MNHNANINPVPVHSAHTHFYDYIESFPGLHADESFANKRVSNLDRLR